MIQDVHNAFFYAPATRDIYVQLHREALREGEHDMCGLLLPPLYGTRDAALNWSLAYTKVLEQLGSENWESSPCTFYHLGKQIRAVIHGDDVVSEGSEKSLRWFEDRLKENFEIKADILGAAGHPCKEVTLLNRVVIWGGAGISWEADHRHAELVVRQLDLEHAKGLATSGSKSTSNKKEPTVKPEEVGEWADSCVMCGCQCEIDHFEDFVCQTCHDEVVDVSTQCLGCGSGMCSGIAACDFGRVAGRATLTNSVSSSRSGGRCCGCERWQSEICKLRQ